MRGVLLTTCLPLAVLAMGSGGDFGDEAPAAKPERSDLKFIRCEVCEHFVGSLHESVKAARTRKEKDGKKKLSESEVQSLVEGACKPLEPSGTWLRHLDLVETDEADGGQRLRVVKHDLSGPCGVECATAALACTGLLEEGWETELGEALYAGRLDAAALSAKACREWSGVCAKRVPRLPASRRPGPAFRAYTDEEREMFEPRGPPPPGMLDVRAFERVMGLRGAPPASEFVEVGDQQGEWTRDTLGRGEAVEGGWLPFAEAFRDVQVGARDAESSEARESALDAS